jgi:hypothetical protein
MHMKVCIYGVDADQGAARVCVRVCLCVCVIHSLSCIEIIYLASLSVPTVGCICECWDEQHMVSILQFVSVSMCV